MDATLLAGIISGGTAVVGALSTAVVSLVKLRAAKKKEKVAEDKQFYLFTASNLVRESERLFGDSNGTEKKQYAMTRLQNEAISSKVAWDPKVASLSIEQAVSLRNDYKNMDVSMTDIIKKEVEEVEEEAAEETKELEEETKEGFKSAIKIAAHKAKDILLKEASEDTRKIIETSEKEIEDVVEEVSEDINTVIKVSED